MIKFLKRIDKKFSFTIQEDQECLDHRQVDLERNRDEITS